jgi:prepilin-type N-terminal cleavage/methylation domain-containing protein
MLKWSAYTLVELIVVVAIVGLLAAFGIPAFSRYGRVTEAHQKTDEIKELVTQMRNLAQNPENSLVDSYRIYYTLGTSPALDKYVLKSCRDDGLGNACGVENTIKEAKMIKDQDILLTGGADPTDWVLSCSTTIVDGKVNCQQNTNILASGNNFAFPVLTDYNSNVETRLDFQITLDPFKIVDSTTPIS